jgi:ATP-dependent Clp protease adaptor protein ClpS
MSSRHSGTEGDLAEVVRSDNTTRVRRPTKCKVVLLNDDYSTMDFVVHILETTFQKSPSEAVQTMLKVHNEGRAVCGYYTHQVAEAKVGEVHSQARMAGFPLRCIIEK